MDLVQSSQAEAAVATRLRFEGRSPPSLGAGINANDPGRPAKNETGYQNSLCSGVHECLPQFHFRNL
jgi:hypothetical protein